MVRQAGAVALLAMIISTSALSGCGGTDNGLPQRFADAVVVMQETGGYTFVADITTDDTPVRSVMTVSGDFQAPNRIAQTISRAGSTPVMMILDGSTVLVRDPTTGTWSSRPSTSTGVVDLRRTFGALSGASDVEIDGSTATFSLAGDAARTLVGGEVTGSATVSVTLGPVGLSELTYRAIVAGRPVQVMLTYTAVGTAPLVTVPARVTPGRSG